jgi:hypothetical protein
MYSIFLFGKLIYFQNQTEGSEELDSSEQSGESHAKDSSCKTLSDEITSEMDEPLSPTVSITASQPFNFVTDSPNGEGIVLEDERKAIDPLPFITKLKKNPRVPLDAPLLPLFDSGMSLSLHDDVTGMKLSALFLMVSNPLSNRADETSTFDFLLKRDSLDIAKHITMYQHRIFSTIQPRDLIQWTLSSAKETDCPAIAELVSHFNKVSSWITAAIVTRLKCSEREALITKVIEVCSNLLELQNFMAIPSVLSSLLHSSVARMERTLKKVKV